jgi:UDP-N-acetylmuramate dehydrogenase
VSTPTSTTPALASLTTLRVGGHPRASVVATTREDLVAEVAAADATGLPVLVVGGGSNLVVADEGFEGTLVQVRTRGVELDSGDSCGGAVVRVAAGEDWDDLVALAVERGWSGLEAMSGIPGSTGATPVQNVGAYGQEVADTLASVLTWDRVDGRLRTFAAADCRFGYRTSRFKTERMPDGTGRHVVLEVVFQLRHGDLSAPVRYGELAARLGIGVGQRAPLAQVRAAVLALRRGKGMVLDAADPDTWSAGSFFTNPVLDAAAAASLPEGAPRFDAGDGRVKTSAAWLVEHAGFPRGTGLPGPAAISTKHTLALTNRGTATTTDVLALARTVRDGVRARFGVELVPEPELVGCRL